MLSIASMINLSHTYANEKRLNTDQLIQMQEEMLLVEDRSSSETGTNLNSETNRALHCMAAHLYRYGQELSTLTDLVQSIKQYHTTFNQVFIDQGFRTAQTSKSLSRGLGRITTQLSAISGFRNELQLKTDNVLALVSVYFHGPSNCSR